MCDPECRKRFIEIEMDIATITADINWIKKIIGATCVAMAALYGVDISGVVG